jgi:hypothetical protein
MAEYRTGVPRREGITGVRGMSTSAGTGYTPAKETDNLGFAEPVSLRNSSDKSRNEKFSAQKFDPNSGMTVRKWGSPDGQEYEQVKKVGRSLKDIEDDANWIMSMGSVPGPNDRDLTDRECCAWLRINAPSTVESGSTSGISAGNKKGCVYVWSVEECNPSYWGCGAITAAGTGGSGAGIHETSKGVVFVAPTIPDKETTNCGRTVDTKIKVAILTADGKKQLASENGTAGWSGFGMGPGDLLYDLFGPENVCDDTATITTRADDCPGYCNGAEIGYTTQHMATGSAQNLSVVNANPNAEYEWMLSGGGSLTKTKGPTTTYAAPISNFNCEESALITLKCSGGVVDTLGIAVYAKESEHVIFGTTKYLFSIFKPVCQDYYGGCDGVPGLCGILWVSNSYWVFCDGSYGAVINPESRSWCRGQCNIPCKNPPCSSTAPPCGNDTCFDEVGWCGITPSGVSFADLYLTGCCPAPPV